MFAKQFLQPKLIFMVKEDFEEKANRHSKSGCDFLALAVDL